MRRSSNPAVLILLLTAACRDDVVPSEPEAPTAAVGHETAALASNSWEGRWAMPTGRRALATATVNGVVYTIGGHLASTGAPTNRVEAHYPFVLTLIPWQVKQPLPEPRAATNGAAVINGKIYVSGGYELVEDEAQGDYLRATNSLYRYDPSTNNWSSRAGMPRASARGATVAIDGKLYVYVAFGGDNAESAALYRYDPSTNKWTTRKTPPSAQFGAAATALNGRMYVIGGNTGKLTQTDKVIVYNPATDRWSTREPMPTPRMGSAAGKIDGRIYVAGGWTKGDGVSADLEVYDPATNTWTAKATMPTPRADAGGAVVSGRLFVIGGKDYDDGQTNEMYQP
jgi:N-acetylneuraminic acid mutarotase